MRIKKFVAPFAAVAVAAAVVAVPQSASAVTYHHMVGFAGGSAIKAVGDTVESDLTSQSSVDTVQTGVTHANTLATATVLNLATIGAISTSASTAATSDGGVQVTTIAQTAGANLLDGAITVKAVKTTDVTTVHGDGTTSSAITTEFVGLKVGNAHIPVNIPQNFHITLPGVANVFLNAAFTATNNNGTIMTEGAGLYISLLKGRGPSPIGTEVFLNPVYGAIATVSPSSGAVLSGFAYGSQILVTGGKLLNVYSGPTAQVSVPGDGTGGKTIKNTTATVTIPSILTAGVLTDTAYGLKGPAGGFSSVTTTTTLAHVNLLGGLITADAVTGSAHVESSPNGTTTTASTTTSILNLVVAGQHIAANVAPNTVINVLNLGRVIIRKQLTNANQAEVTLLEIQVSTANYGLPVGADIKIGYASAGLFLP